MGPPHEEMGTSLLDSKLPKAIATIKAIAVATPAITALHVAITAVGYHLHGEDTSASATTRQLRLIKLSDTLQLGPAQGGGCTNIIRTLGQILQPSLCISSGQVPLRLFGGATSHNGHAPEKLCRGEWFSKSGL